ASMMRKATVRFASVLALACLATVSAWAQPSPVGANANCQNSGSFERWLADFRAEAQADGITRATIAAALDGMSFDPHPLARDRRQSFFAQSFVAFYAKLVSANRLQTRAAKLR